MYMDPPGPSCSKNEAPRSLRALLRSTVAVAFVKVACPMLALIRGVAGRIRDAHMCHDQYTRFMTPAIRLQGMLLQCVTFTLDVTNGDEVGGIDVARH